MVFQNSFLLNQPMAYRLTIAHNTMRYMLGVCLPFEHEPCYVMHL